MKQGFRQSMAWLHTWVGLLPGWVLYVVFLFGTTAFFTQEVNGWMRPELAPAVPTTARALEAADAILRQRAQGAESWSISLPGERGGSGLGLSWRAPGDGERRKVTLDPATGSELAVRDTSGGDFLYDFHYSLHYMPYLWAWYIVCISALAMLVAILSGVVTHKKIFTDFFQLRFGKGQRSWLDAHNVTGVLALPFHLMITYTGLATLLFTLMPWAITANFPDRKSFYEASNPRPQPREASGTLAVPMPLPQLVRKAQTVWGGATPGYIEISHPGDAAAMARLFPARKDWSEPNRPTVYIDAASGKVIEMPVRTPGGAQATHRVMVDLHMAWFAGYGLRWLYFLSGAGGTVLCATGLALWCVKRRTKLPDPARPHLGFRAVERLNIGIIAGAPAGIAIYFLANRLLPLAVPERAEWEINSLFVGWGAVFLCTLARKAKRAWVESLATCAVLFALVPLVNVLTTSRGLVQSLWLGDWVFAGFDLTMTALAVGFAYAARKVLRHQPRASPARKRRAALPPEAEAAA